VRRSRFLLVFPFLFLAQFSDGAGTAAGGGEPVDRTGNWEAADPLAEIPSREGACPPVSRFLDYLTQSKLLSDSELDRFLKQRQPFGEDQTHLLGESLVEHGLVNRYQLKRLLAGQTFGLVLGNYRVLDWLGSGGMGVVYKAEHMHMKRPVALKVLASEEDENDVFLQRFNSEMQALAVLRHPNIVLAFDAGETQFPDRPGRVLRYLVMELVQGRDLEQYVCECGPLSIPLACDFIRQKASGLRHAHEHGLVHRDVKPSNLLVTGLPGPGPHPPGHGQVKILDFGLARLCRRRCTAAYAKLGTVDYMAPEQARDARSVDIRADIYGLGGTLYWRLTAQRPFPSDRPAVEELLARQYETPVPPRSLRPDIPLDLEAIVCQMMARDPCDRYPTPLAVISALNDYLEPHATVVPSSLSPMLSASDSSAGGSLPGPCAAVAEALTVARSRRVLVASARAEFRAAWVSAMEGNGLACREAERDHEVAVILANFPADVVMIDSAAAPAAALELCRRLRAEAPVAHLKLVLLAPRDAEPPEADGLYDDFLEDSTPPARLVARVRAALRLKEAEERADRAAGHLLTTNSQLEQALEQRDHTAMQAQDVLIFAMAKMAELRGQETGAHLLRMQQYMRVLAEEAMRLPAFATRIDDAFVRMLERCVLLHDIGKVAIPDHILLKPGRLDPEERSLMESHTILGAHLLEAVAKQHGACQALLSMATDVVRSHHERYDGEGYPDGLCGDAIPLAARIVSVADVYDAMRSKLVYKPGLSHAAARRLLTAPEQGQFDPALLVAFRNCEAAFKNVFERTLD
jgi:response regulator RpfG family c-di-GMP phosphodiesterase/serine/threonine protein kinase